MHDIGLQLAQQASQCAQVRKRAQRFAADVERDVLAAFGSSCCTSRPPAETTMERWPAFTSARAISSAERSAPPECIAGINWTMVSNLAGATVLDMSSELETFIRGVKQKRCREFLSHQAEDQSRST